MGKIITFGEIMLRLSPEGCDRFTQVNKFNAVYGGSEANVAVSLASFGKDTGYVTKLPNNDIAQSAVNQLRRYGVDTKNIVRGGDRIGLYFCETGKSQRPAKLVYDRKNSAIALSEKSDFDWQQIFKGVSWFHFSGITPALSDSCAAITLNAVKEAKKEGITVSVDLNYRKNLWNVQKYSKVMNELLKYCDVVLGCEDEAEMVLGIKPNTESCNSLLKKLFEKYDLKYSVIILRNMISPVEIDDWTSVLYDGHKYYNAQKYTIDVADNMGGGDALGAGIIYGITSGFSNQDIVEFATAASCLKYTINGDANISSVEEVKALMKGKGSGTISR